jgi:hypothetical protein
MIRSRMLTPLFRLFAGWAAFSLLMAALFGLASNADHPFTFGGSFPWVHNDDLVNAVVGPITIGWKGPVGNHVGYAIWLGVAACAAFLAGLLVAFRDADPEAVAEVVQAETVPLTRAPSGPSAWPIVAAIAIGLMALGWVINTPLMMAGVGLLAVSAVVWTFRAWADRATGDDEVNAAIYHRIIDPMRVPVLALLLIGLVVFDLSQILKAVDRLASIYIFLATFVVFALLFAAVALLKAPRSVVTTLIVVLFAALIGGGIWATVHGTRDFGQEEQEGGAANSGTGEGGLAPVGGAPIVVQVTS